VLCKSKEVTFKIVTFVFVLNRHFRAVYYRGLKVSISVHGVKM